MRYKLLTGCLLLWLPLQGYASESLIYAIDLIRHGDRTPTRKLKTVNYEWKEGLGQLTSLGMEQEYELGRKLGQQYKQQLLLPERYEVNTLYARSTDYDRTLMSAEASLMGVYPDGKGPHGHQPIPIHTAPADVDNVILGRLDHDEVDKLMQRYVYSTLAWQQKETELKHFFKHWSEATGVTINTLADVDMGDALRIHRLHGAPLPAGLTSIDIDTIIDADAWMFVMEHRTRPVAAYYSQNLVNYIAASLEKNANTGKHLKYTLLSAHDSTIASVLTLLGAPLDTPPPYASDLNFSIYESGNNNYFVRITYNGKPVIIPACAGSECTLAQFKAAAAGKTQASG